MTLKDIGYNVSMLETFNHIWFIIAYNDFMGLYIVYLFVRERISNMDQKRNATRNDVDDHEDGGYHHHDL